MPVLGSVSELATCSGEDPAAGAPPLVSRFRLPEDGRLLLPGLPSVDDRSRSADDDPIAIPNPEASGVQKTEDNLT